MKSLEKQIRPILIKTGGLVDVEHETILPNAFVLVEGDKISAVGSQKTLGSGEALGEVIDLSDRYVLPGLINSHAHLCMPADGTPLTDFQTETNEIWLLTAARNAHKALMSGVTTVRDCGDRDGLVFQLRRAIEKGLAEGPRIIQSGSFITMTGGHAYQEGREVDGVEEMVKAVRRSFKEGSDFIKVMATGGGTPGTYPEFASFSVPELSAAVETAHRIGKTVAAHCRGIPGICNAIEAGVDHIEHACFELPEFVLQFDPIIADRIAASGIYVTPTIQLYRDMVNDLIEKQEIAPLSKEEEKKLNYMSRCVEEKLRSLQGMLDAGVVCVAGDDAGLPLTPFDRFWQELDAMEAGGMTAMQTMVAATKTAATAMGRLDEIGSIAVGKQADIIAVESDPCRDITALANPSFIMRAGRIYRL
jgi:imidazolonepropionase-like amidohydrolase